MPVLSCGNGKYRIGTGPCMYTSKESAERAYRGYLGSKSEANIDHLHAQNIGDSLWVLDKKIQTHQITQTDTTTEHEKVWPRVHLDGTWRGRYDLQTNKVTIIPPAGMAWKGLRVEPRIKTLLKRTFGPGIVFEGLAIRASLDKPFPYQWRSRQSYSWIGKFTTGTGLDYRVSFDMEHEDLGEGYDEELWAWQFYVDNHKYGITGTGDAGQVFATVIAMFEEFNKRIQPAVVAFESKEPSRTKLYERMVARYIRSWGFDKVEKIRVGSEHAFVMINTHLQDIDRRERVAAALASVGFRVCGGMITTLKGSQK